MRHHRLRASAKEVQEIVNEPSTRRLSRDLCLEDMGIADLANAAHRAFLFQPVGRRLNSGVRGPVRFWKGFLDFPDRKFALVPQGLHNLQLERAQLRQLH
jgi:hypothetical protein